MDNGPGWAVLRCATAGEVLALKPDLSQIPDAAVGVIGFYPLGSAETYELRAFIPRAGIDEDPVTGGLNASVAQWLTATGQVPRRYAVSQGLAIGRRGRIDISVDADGTVWVGGATTTRVRGQVTVQRTVPARPRHRR